jgi:hypothetical protein
LIGLKFKGDRPSHGTFALGNVKLYNIGWSNFHGIVFEIKDEDDLLLLTLSSDLEFEKVEGENRLVHLSKYNKDFFDKKNVGSFYGESMITMVKDIDFYDSNPFLLLPRNIELYDVGLVRYALWKDLDIERGPVHAFLFNVEEIDANIVTLSGSGTVVEVDSGLFHILALIDLDQNTHLIPDDILIKSSKVW